MVHFIYISHRKFNKNDIFNKMSNTISKRSNNYLIKILVGDLNIDLLDASQYTLTKLLDLLDVFDF